MSVEYHARLFRFLADANVALGPAGLEAARAVIAAVPPGQGGTAPMFIALLSLSRHGPSAPEIDTLAARLGEPLGGQVVVTPIVEEIHARGRK